MEEARLVCDFIEQGGDAGGARASGSRRRPRRASTSSATCSRVGIANQTTMLSGESLAIAEEVRRSMVRRYGDAAVASTSGRSTRSAPPRRSGRTRSSRSSRSRSTSWSWWAATTRSNTCHLAALVHSRGRPRLPHRGRRCGGPADGRDPPPADRHQAGGADAPAGSGDARIIGITAGASTPNNKIGETVARICALAGVAGSCECRPGDRSRLTFVDLSHTINHGMTTYPGLPGPIICDFLSRERRAACTRPAWSSRSARSRWWPTPAPTWTRRSIAIADGKDLSGLRWNRWRTWTRWWCRPLWGWVARSSLRAFEGRRAPGPRGAGPHRVGPALGHRALPLGESLPHGGRG